MTDSIMKLSIAIAAGRNFAILQMRKHLEDPPCHSVIHSHRKMDIWNFAKNVKVFQGPESQKAGILGILDTEEHFSKCKD